MSTKLRLILGGSIILVAASGYLAYRLFAPAMRRSTNVMSWIRDPQAHSDWAIQAGQRCVGAPFILPTNGFIGYLWDDPFKISSRHQGIDIFGGTGLNQTPVLAAYSGFLTRQADWKSSLIIRIPDDPLQPGRQIWTYYTHMADPQGNSFILTEFPPGTYETFVASGALLGYQGDYSGDAENPVGIHLHFSIVLDNGQGKYRNELDIHNTLDPSPYLGIPLNASRAHPEIPTCKS